MSRGVSVNGSRTSDTSTFHVPPERIDGRRVVFGPDEQRHIGRVLRLHPGAVVEVLDGAGGIYLAELVRAEGDRLDGRIVESRRVPRPAVRIGVALAVGRKERMATAVEKLCELGCGRVVPLLCEHTSFPGDPGKLVPRLTRVAVSAMKQSRQPFLTDIEQPVRFDTLFDARWLEGAETVFAVQDEPGQQERKERAHGVRPAEYLLVVGPEGGFSPRELEKIEAAGAARLHLGKSVLRFETAAVCGFAVLSQFRCGNFYLY